MSAGISGPISGVPPQLIRNAFKPGRSGNISGRPKGLVSLKRRFRQAFDVAPPDGKESLVEVVLSIARGEGMTAVLRQAVEQGLDPENAKAMAGLTARLNRTAEAQLNAIKFAASYGFGPPPKSLDDETTRNLAEQMVAAMLTEARARAAERAAAIAAPVTVEPAK